MKKIMKITICMIFVMTFISIATAQTKTKVLVGTVVNVEVGNRWAGITVKVGKKKYFILTSSAAAPADPSQEVAPTPKTVGNVEKVGQKVKIFYTKIVNNEIQATKVIAIKK